ncbi:hypothetical protein G9X64_06900 [Rhizobium sophorae]|uniref:Uncharacterized protein n=1 Tax=Rhizobium sophorae TaxID=1535242 RepID=A0A7Y3S419_9HYPH|nr:hypothetical protein [Rhizobium sophorae]NKK72895.1 hypothetical protein [Rhizobium leguminosarum bv. viciae]NKL37937.1 hypothetical protein [Rhizobium leguminosarum bv. viciae]NNU36215.1 hypothetical protein [Rhizobium sophorae]
MAAIKVEGSGRQTWQIREPDSVASFADQPRAIRQNHAPIDILILNVRAWHENGSSAGRNGRSRSYSGRQAKPELCRFKSLSDVVDDTRWPLQLSSRHAMFVGPWSGKLARMTSRMALPTSPSG